MQQTKLLAALRTLTPRERARWRAWVHSDFHNKHALLRRLCDLALAHAPGFAHPDLDKRRVHAALFGDEVPFNELAINNLISDLLELLHDFLAFQRYENRPMERRLDLVEALLQRDLDKSAAAALEQTRRALDEAPPPGVAGLRAEQRWWELRETLHSRRPRRDPGESLRHLADAADLALVLEKLRLACAMLGRNALAVVQADYQPRRLDDLRRWCAEEPLFAEHPALQTYLAALALLEQPEPATFDALNAALDRHHALFPPEELAALYQYALNYCIRRINDGQPEGHRQALTLYQTLLERNLLTLNGHLSQWTYKNITTAGLRCREFAWTEDFLRRYRESLPPADRDNAFAYNLAALFFEQEQYAPALRALQGVEFTDFTYHLGAKIIQLKSYFLLGETEALAALLDATTKLLRRNRSLSTYGKTANLNFIKALRELSRQSSARRAAQPGSKLADKIRAMQPLANKEWLLGVV